MDDIYLPPMERRLQERYIKLVKGHMHHSSRSAAGLTAVLDQAKGFAATQAAWRFLNNPRVTLAALAEPLRQAGRAALDGDKAPVALLIHDWCKLGYGAHRSKRDVVQLTHEHDRGYELATTLLVSAADGSPLAPMQIHLKTADGLHSTEVAAPSADIAHIDQVLPTMEASGSWGLPKPLVHVIDREADSVDHYRQWDQAGQLFLVRADNRRVNWRGESKLLSEVIKAVTEQETLTVGRSVEYKNRPAFQQVTETMVTLDRPGKKRVGGRQRQVSGRPLDLRLIVSRIVDAEGKALATWMLLTNVQAKDADAASIALWYYWRWRIESFFKLLKSQGQEIEHWQQENGAAIARRLLVAIMACVVVWQLQRQSSPQAQELKTLLVRLSGRQMKRRVPHTASSLLAGLFVLLPMLTLIDEYDGNLQNIKQLALRTMPLLRPG